MMLETMHIYIYTYNVNNALIIYPVRIYIPKLPKLRPVACPPFNGAVFLHVKLIEVDAISGNH